jgi:hypothetical protein
MDEVILHPLVSPTNPEVLMARRSRLAALDPLADLAKKMEILERELAVQREAMDRLKELSTPPRLASLPAEKAHRAHVAFDGL